MESHIYYIDLLEQTFTYYMNLFPFSSFLLSITELGHILLLLVKYSVV